MLRYCPALAGTVIVALTSAVLPGEVTGTGNAVGPVRVSDAADNQWRTGRVQRREYRIEQVGADSSILQVGEVQDLSATAYIASIGTQTSNTGEEIRRGRARWSERQSQEIKISVAIESLEVGMVQDIEGIGAQFQADMLCVGYLECFLH